ncbi:MAG: beta-N-acetylhexosaminidase [Desulfobacteraceae bacterium]|nr:beta-N-acetylhexosaminidase [Desulfobacteraceae bacterium]
MGTMKNLSNDQMTGQRLMVGFDGTEFNAGLKFLIGTLKVGGIILFARNIENPGQLTRLCGDMRDYARACGQPPLFISIDQEGGAVARLRQPHFREFPGIPALSNPVDAKNFALDMAGELSALGINMNMAPVLDIAPREMQSIMARRSFGHDPMHVAAMGKAMIENFQKQRIMAVAKHFPGIGRTILDSHLDMPEFDASLDDLIAFDLIPFQGAVKAGVAGMMLSHIYYKQIDPRWPASLSPAIASGLLRRRMGFDGIVMTDDLDMGAIVKHFDIRTIIGQILASEIDIALICHKGPNIQIAFDEIQQRTADDEGFAQKNRESAARIMRLKAAYGLAES